MKFKIIDKHTEELVKGSSFLAKLKGKNADTIKMLTDNYNKDIKDFDNTVAMCFYQWFLADDKLDLSDTNSVFQITFDVINKIEDTLELCPEYWILWILKYKIISYMNFDEEQLMASLRKLIEEQNEGETMPYYMVTDVLLAHVSYSKGMRDESKAMLENLMDRYTQRVNVLTNFFEGFVIEFRNVLLRSQDDDLLDLINTIRERYF